MKTDRFTDIIRRKLESIRPGFTDKDWARMQNTLKDANLSNPPGTNQPFSGGVWSGQSWLLAAASISTVALIAFSIWQQREINQLRQTVGQIQHQPATTATPIPGSASAETSVRPDVAHSDKTSPPKLNQEVNTTPANRNEGQAVRPDTVYITRYVPTPPQRRQEQHREEQLSQRTETPTEPQYATEKSKLPSVTVPQTNSTNKNQQTESYDVSSTPSVAQKTESESSITNTLPSSSITETSSANRNSRARTPKGNRVSPSTYIDNQGSLVQNKAGRSGRANKGNVSTQQTETVNPASIATETPNVATEEAVALKLATSLPLDIKSKNWNVALAQRARRMRPAQPVQPTVVAEPTKEPESSRPARSLAVRFRAGAGADVSSGIWSAGLYTEALVGRHWTVGVGLSQATSTNRFITDEDFNMRTHRDFRKEFAPRLDPWRDILNIDTRQVRIQMPVNLGYRIPLNKTLSLLPTVGTYLNLNNDENVTYYCREIQFMPQKPVYRYNEYGITKNQPFSLISSLALSVGLDWQHGHWAAQLSPVLNIPTQSQANAPQTDLNWQPNTSLGARVRLYYQF
ncbi:hypothetical protein [Spirosoma sp. KNUC1025]|uniref:hypothetical protein n=1 Tax=Spirosoma sp. KNUC1025 TaxID=2894082 RepID=UPI0038681906|nr:hypothetical protein LN737_24450 [Spirosoma sp. KNUC1025]